MVSPSLTLFSFFSFVCPLALCFFVLSVRSLSVSFSKTNKHTYTSTNKQHHSALRCTGPVPSRRSCRCVCIRTLSVRCYGCVGWLAVCWLCVGTCGVGAAGAKAAATEPASSAVRVCVVMCVCVCVCVCVFETSYLLWCCVCLTDVCL